MPDDRNLRLHVQSVLEIRKKNFEHSKKFDSNVLSNSMKHIGDCNHEWIHRWMVNDIELFVAEVILTDYNI